MSLSIQSETYLQFIVDNCFLDGYRENNLDINHKIYKNFLPLFQSAQKFVDSIEVNISVIPLIMKPNDYNYILPIIQNYIQNNIKKTNFFSFKMQQKNISIYIMEEEKTIVTSQEMKNYILLILFWLNVVTQFPTENCSTYLNIYIYLTSLQKTLPTNESVIKKEHINTGYTTTCNYDSNIVIFRKEEWFKVFIHETMHNFGLDFSSIPMNNEITKQILSIFPVNSKVNLYEAYTDSWAKVLNCLIISFKQTKTENDYLLNADFMIDMERMFSVFQTVKLLKFMGLKYTDLFSPDLHIKNKYVESTNILSYYIITAILYDNISLFFDWCLKNNVNMLQFNNSDIKFHLSFCDLIKNLYKTPSFLKKIKNMEKIYDKMDKNLQFTKITIKSICSLH